MSFFERLKTEASAEWRAYTEHPFTNGLADGSLVEAAFRHYLVQDYLFLTEFARAYALSVYKSPKLADMREAAAGLSAILDIEMNLHVKLCAGWGLSPSDLEQTPPAVEMLAYIRISPRDPRSHRWLHYLGWCHWKLGDLEQMEAASRGSIELYSDAPAQWLELTCALGLQGKLEESRKAGAILKKLAPEMSAKGFFETAKRFYGKRFPGEVEAEYRTLCATLDDAL